MANIDSRSTPTYGWLERATWLISVVLTAIFLTCVQFTTTSPFKFASFHRLVHFNSVEPFQHRVLLPAIAAGIQQVAAVGEALLFAAFEVIAWVALIMLAYRALAMFGIGRCDLTRRLLAFSIVIPMFVHLVVREIHIPHVFVVGAHGLTLGAWKPWLLFYYVYDLPAAVFTLLLVLMLARQAERPSRYGFAAYIVLFAVATFNRETTVFLISFFALLFWARVPWMRWLGLIVLQLVIFAGIQFSLHWIFRHQLNPSPTAGLANTQYENHLFENLGMLANPLYLLVFLARFMAGLYIPVLLWWRYLDARLARALLGFALPLIVFAMIAGRLPEHRIFIEVVPLVWISAMQVIARRGAVALAAEQSENSPTRAAVAPTGDLSSPGALPTPAAADERDAGRTAAMRGVTTAFAQTRPRKIH